MSGQSEVLKELLVSLGYKIDGSSEKKFKSSIADMTELLAGLAAAAAAAAAAAVLAVNKVAKSFEDLYWSSQRVHASVGNLKAFGYAFSQLGGSAADAKAAVESFAAQLRTNRGVESFVQQFGVTTRKTNGELRDATDTLEDFVAAVRKKYPDYDVAYHAGEVAGIDERTFKLIWDHIDAIKKLKKEQKEAADRFGVDQDQAGESLKDFLQAWRDFSKDLDLIGDKILSEFSKPMTAALRALQSWLEDHSEDVKKILNEIADKAGEAAKWIGEGGLTRAFNALADGIKKVIELARPLLEFFDRINLGNMDGPGPAWLRFADPELANRLYGRGGGGGPGGAGGPGSTPSEPITKGEAADNQAKAYATLRASGLTHEAAAGILASIQTESGFNPSIPGDGGAAKGLFQYHKDRRDAILQGTGIDVWNAGVEDQVKGALWEMQHGSDPKARMAWQALSNPSITAWQAGAIFSRDFERPARDQAAERGALAEKIAKAIPDAQSSGSSSGSGIVHWFKSLIGIDDKAPEQKQSANPGQFEALKKAADNGSFTTDVLRRSYLGQSSVSNDNSNAVTLNQKTEINVIGGSNPTDTAEAVHRGQVGVNSTLLRNAQGAVR